MSINIDKEKHTIERMTELQDKLYAQDTYGVLILFQALDAAGKDGTIKHVMSGINPQGCDVNSFKTPSTEELDHDYLWRSLKVLPEGGRIGIFNGQHFWEKRFEQINNFEKYLVDNGIIVSKFFLNVSKEEQKRRFLERIDLPEKNWKFSANDLKERAFWDDYMNAYETMFNHTSTSWSRINIPFTITIGGILDKNKITIAAVAFLAGAAALFATIVIFEIDLVKWANCNAPFSPPDDKKSEICRR